MIFPGTRKIELETKNKDVSQYVLDFYNHYSSIMIISYFKVLKPIDLDSSAEMITIEKIKLFALRDNP